MKKMITAVFAFALLAGVTAAACDSCPAHAKKDAKKECATKCDKDKKECSKEKKAEVSKDVKKK